MDPEKKTTAAEQRQPTPAEITAKATLENAERKLQEAQEAVTSALVPVAALEASRHADMPRLVQAISEARGNVANAQRTVSTLLEYGLPGEHLGALGIAAVMEKKLAGAYGQRVRYTEDASPSRGC